MICEQVGGVVWVVVACAACFWVPSTAASSPQIAWLGAQNLARGEIPKFAQFAAPDLCWLLVVSPDTLGTMPATQPRAKMGGWAAAAAPAAPTAPTAQPPLPCQLPYMWLEKALRALWHSGCSGNSLYSHFF
jgi:hypothetical protein